MARIHIEVPDAQKEEWMNYAEENAEYSSFTHFLQLAAINEIRDDEGKQQSAAEIDLTPVNSKLADLDDKVDDLLDELDHLQIVNESTRDEDLMDLAHRVQQLLPLVDDTDSLVELLTGDPGIARPPAEQAQITGRVADIAVALDEDEYNVERAAARLEQDMTRVESIVLDGDRSYFEVEQDTSIEWEELHEEVPADAAEKAAQTIRTALDLAESGDPIYGTTDTNVPGEGVSHSRDRGDR